MRTMQVVLPSLLVMAPAAAQESHPWRRGRPEEHGLISAPLADVTRRAHAGAFGNVDRLVVVRNGTLVWSERFERDYGAVSRARKSALGCGIDACTDSTELHEFNYLHPTWHPYYRGRPVHTLQSVTKSVTATLIGVALLRREIPNLNVPLLSFFADYDLSRVDARLHKATLVDLLTMRTGIEWHEQDRPLNDTNTTMQLEKSRDWIRFTLAQPMDADPGSKWVYNSGGSQLMSEVIRKATGQQVDRYAQQHLFGPLGISDFHWKKTPTGHSDTEGGLYLEAEDLARIGQLYLDDGVWKGRRILPAGWAKEATARHVDRVNAGGAGYGYQWWRMDRQGTEVWAGIGFGGQFLLILPQHQIVAVVNSWNVFGAPAAPIVAPLVEALVAAALRP